LTRFLASSSPDLAPEGVPKPSTRASAAADMPAAETFANFGKTESCACSRSLWPSGDNRSSSARNYERQFFCYRPPFIVHGFVSGWTHPVTHLGYFANSNSPVVLSSFQLLDERRLEINNHSQNRPFRDHLRRAMLRNPAQIVSSFVLPQRRLYPGAQRDPV
jgi:hypothetical protein